MNEILNEFKENAIELGIDYFIYSPEISLRIVERCKEKNKRIFGIDVFSNDKGNEVIDYIDYTAEYYQNFDESEYKIRYNIIKNYDKGHWEESCQFIRDRMDQNTYFEILFE